jgi:hypothetical protein
MNKWIKRVPYSGPERRKSDIKHNPAVETDAIPKRLTLTGRHPAISDELKSFQNYDEWVRQMRAKWESSQ